MAHRVQVPKPGGYIDAGQLTAAVTVVQILAAAIAIALLRSWFPQSLEAFVVACALVVLASAVMRTVTVAAVAFVVVAVLLAARVCDGLSSGVSRCATAIRNLLRRCQPWAAARPRLRLPFEDRHHANAPSSGMAQPPPWQVQVDLLNDGPLTPTTRPRVRVVLRYMSDERQRYHLVVVTKLGSRQSSMNAVSATVNRAQTLDVGDRVSLDVTLPRPDWSRGVPGVLSVAVYRDKVSTSNLLSSHPAEFRLPAGMCAARHTIATPTQPWLCEDYYALLTRVRYFVRGRGNAALFNVQRPRPSWTQLLGRFWAAPLSTTLVVGPAGSGKSSFVNLLMSLSAETHEEWCPVYRVPSGHGKRPRTTRAASRVQLRPAHVLMDTYAPHDAAEIQAVLTGLLQDVGPARAITNSWASSSFAQQVTVMFVVPAPAALQLGPASSALKAAPTVESGDVHSDDECDHWRSEAAAWLEAIATFCQPQGSGSAHGTAANQPMVWPHVKQQPALPVGIVITHVDHPHWSSASNDRRARAKRFLADAIGTATTFVVEINCALKKDWDQECMLLEAVMPALLN